MKKRKSTRGIRRRIDMPTYRSALSGIMDLLDTARRASARTVNAIMTATYWELGRRIVELEQGGKGRADYGKELLKRLSADLTPRFGRGFSHPNLYKFRQFYATYSMERILSTASIELSDARSLNSLGSSQPSLARLQSIAARFPLPWSHYVRLLSVKNLTAREFYEAEAFRGGWTVRQLHRQIGSQFYERTALSRNKAAMLLKGRKPRSEDAVSADEEVRNPLVLEFLGLKDEYSESDLENALIEHLESFLLELGNDFAFVGRQKRLRIDNEWFRIDLLFFHRCLRSLIVIDLKTGPLSHADIGQMHLYLNYARAHWVHSDENPPIGLILCTERGESLARYALEGLPNKMLIREYQTALPSEKLLAAEIDKARRYLEGRTRRTRR